MIPPVLSERAASLEPDEDRPAVSILVRIGAAGRAQATEIVASIIRSRARLEYKTADALLAGSGGGAAEALRSLEGLAIRLEEERAGAGAVLIRAPETSVKVGAGGEVILKRIDERGPARRLVAEFMILANTLVAEFCAGKRVPAVYRKQPPPIGEPPAVPEGPYDPVAVRAVRKSLRRGEVSLAPGPHYALGVSAYTQITSPLRRYQDLAMQRQIKAVLAGLAPPYEPQDVARIAATTEEAERCARQAEAGATSYWILKYLQSKIGAVVEGVVVETEPRRSLVELTETLRVAAIAPRPDHVAGMLLRLVVVSVAPRQGTLHLRETEGDGTC